MKGMLKKSLALLLTLTMVFGAAPLAGLVGIELPSLKDVFADKAEAATYGVLTYEINNGEVTITDCDETASGELVIPDEIEEFLVTSIGDDAFYSCTGLTSVTIPFSVTSIGYRAFSDCTRLTSLTIPDSVTSIGDDAFYDTGIYNNSNNWENNVLYIGNHLIKADSDLSGSYAIIKGTKTIAGDAFYSCTGLTSITIPDSVTSIGDRAFDSCDSLTSIIIPDSVTSIGNYAFYHCNRLTSVTISGSKTIIGKGAFNNTGLYNDSSNWENDVLYIGNYLIEAKTTISGAYVIKSGTKVIAGSVFYGCKGLTAVMISDGVTSIGESAFEDCTGLTMVTMSDSVTSIGDSVFHGCTGLTRVTISDSVTSIGNYAFSYCTGLTSVTIPGSITSIDDGAFCGCSGLTSITIPESVTSIGNYAFDGCKRLTSITIPDSITSIGNYAFSDCTRLTSIKVDENNLYYSSDEFGVLYNKDKTELIQYPNGNTITTLTIPDSVTSIGDGAFCGCKRLTSITIPDSVTSIGDFAFRDCTGLTSITIPNSVTSIGEDAFLFCSGLTNITIPDSVTIIGDYAFEYCTGLTSVTIPGGVTSVGYYAFAQCSCLSSVIISDGIDNIEPGMFSGCTKLTSVTIPNGVTSIGYYAFRDCTGLTSITIPNSVTNIGTSAFSGCTGLTDVYYRSSEAEWNKIAIGSYNDPIINANIHFNYVSDTNVTEEPIIDDEVVKNPSNSSITYGDSIILHVDSSIIPEGGHVEWAASNSNFSMSVSADGLTCKISPKSNGKTVFTATVYDKDGNVISSDSQEMTAKAGLWQKIVAFFKKIFGLTKTFPEAFKGII